MAKASGKKKITFHLFPEATTNHEGKKVTGHPYTIRLKAGKTPPAKIMKYNKFLMKRVEHVPKKGARPNI